MNLEFIGIGGAFCPGLGCNCAYIKENKKILFIDFGMDAFAKVIKYNLLDDVEEVYIIVTHFHGDHIGGLFTLVDYCYFNMNIVVRILDNSFTFTNKLVNLMELTGIESRRFAIKQKFEFNFDFDVKIEKTSHSPLLECYSIVFEKDGKKVLYTSDSNDINNVRKAIKDDSFEKIYCEVGENSPIHIDYYELKNLDKAKLILMHFSSEELYEIAKNDGFVVPNYLK